MNMASMNGGAGGAHGGAGGQVLTMNRDGSYHNSAIIPNFNHNQVSCTLILFDASFKAPIPCQIDITFV